jgi:large subunit ribosomal protein L35
MQKLKTKRGAAKRFFKTSTGKFKRAKACKGHLLEWKTRKRKRNLRKNTYIISGKQKKNLKRLLPYS